MSVTIEGDDFDGGSEYLYADFSLEDTPKRVIAALERELATAKKLAAKIEAKAAKAKASKKKAAKR